MKFQKWILLLSVVVMVSTVSLFAQVEKVAMRTTGISCGVCALVSEIQFRRMVGIDKVTISRSNEAIMVTYKPGVTSFRPQEFRDLLKSLEVGVLQFQISARGRVQEENGKRFFLTGKDKYALVTVANTPQVPRDTPVLVEGILNDQTSPMQLKIMTFTPVK